MYPDFDNDSHATVSQSALIEDEVEVDCVHQCNVVTPTAYAKDNQGGIRKNSRAALD